MLRRNELLPKVVLSLSDRKELHSLVAILVRIDKLAHAKQPSKSKEFIWSTKASKKWNAKQSKSKGSGKKEQDIGSLKSGPFFMRKNNLELYAHSCNVLLHTH